MEHIQNAIITKATLTIEDHGVLSVWLHLKYSNNKSQGYGGFNLYSTNKESPYWQFQTTAGHFIVRCLETAGVLKWDDLVGRNIRVKLDQEGLFGKILAIGHIIEDKWFNFQEDFKKYQIDKQVITDKSQQPLVEDLDHLYNFDHNGVHNSWMSRTHESREQSLYQLLKIWNHNAPSQTNKR